MNYLLFFLAFAASLSSVICFYPSFILGRATSTTQQIGRRRPASLTTTTTTTTSSSTFSTSSLAAHIQMPALSSTMKEGRVVSWLKSPGDHIAVGEAIATIESDKADMDMEAFEDGFMAKILVEEGESALVGATIALISETEEGIDAFASGSEPESEPASSVAATPTSTASTSTASTTSSSTAPTFDYESVQMPALSSTMKSGKVVSWEVPLYSKITSGQALLTVESDKADMEVEHLGEDGHLAAIMCEEGESALVGGFVALIAREEADVPALEAYADVLKRGGGGEGESVMSASSPAPVSAAITPVSSKPSSSSSDRIIASPLAKSRAKELNIDLSTASGTGPGGRITVTDVESQKAPFSPLAPPSPSSTTSPSSTSSTSISAHVPAAGVIAATPMARALAKKNKLDLSKMKGTGEFGRVTLEDVNNHLGVSPSKPAAAVVPVPGAKAAGPVFIMPGKTALPSGTVPFTGMQRAVSKNMEATLGVPTFRVSRVIKMDAFDELYQALKPKGITLSALLTKAIAKAIEKHPIMNSAYDSTGPGTKFNADINIANAVALDGGLITPTLKRANLRTVEDLAMEWKELIANARAGTLKPTEYQSGTFAVTNLGMFGVSQFDAILPPGMGSILAIGGTSDVLVVDKRSIGGLRVEKQMIVTVTCDHRTIYGSDAAEFLKTFAAVMEKAVFL